MNFTVCMLVASVVRCTSMSDGWADLMQPDPALDLPTGSPAAISDAINSSARYASDLSIHGVSDRREHPSSFLARGAGDCEEFALAKYAALKRAGHRAGILVGSLEDGSGHAVAITSDSVSGDVQVLDIDGSPGKIVEPVGYFTTDDDAPYLMEALTQPQDFVK